MLFWFGVVLFGWCLEDLGEGPGVLFFLCGVGGWGWGLIPFKSYYAYCRKLNCNVIINTRRKVKFISPCWWGWNWGRQKGDANGGRHGSFSCNTPEFYLG